MKFPSSTSFALLGAALIAISYGLARFAFGLFVPPIREELGLAPDVIGVIGALPLISFVFATMVAPLSANRLGARNTAMASGIFGVVGLALISQAVGAVSLGVGVVLCGICTGLMMPALTAAMQALVRRSLHGRVSSVMNAGTSVGVMIAVPTILFLVLYSVCFPCCPRQCGAGAANQRRPVVAPAQALAVRFHDGLCLCRLLDLRARPGG